MSNKSVNENRKPLESILFLTFAIGIRYYVIRLNRYELSENIIMQSVFAILCTEFSVTSSPSSSVWLHLRTVNISSSEIGLYHLAVHKVIEITLAYTLKPNESVRCSEHKLGWGRQTKAIVHLMNDK